MLFSLLFGLIFLPAHADFYKCNINGEMVFSDQPCSKSAEKIDIKVKKPDQEDIVKQQQRTLDYQDSSRIRRIEELKAENDTLRQQIPKLIKQHDAEIAELEKDMFQVSDTHVASYDKMLFKKMEAVTEKYQTKINHIERQIKRNENKVTELSMQAR